MSQIEKQRTRLTKYAEDLGFVLSLARPEGPGYTWSVLLAFPDGTYQQGPRRLVTLNNPEGESLIRELAAAAQFEKQHELGLHPDVVEGCADCGCLARRALSVEIRDNWRFRELELAAEDVRKELLRAASAIAGDLDRLRTGDLALEEDEGGRAMGPGALLSTALIVTQNAGDLRRLADAAIRAELYIARRRAGIAVEE